MFLSATNTTSPPWPPSPPFGPPRSMNCSRRKATQPLPPLPALARIRVPVIALKMAVLVKRREVFRAFKTVVNRQQVTALQPGCDVGKPIQGAEVELGTVACRQSRQAGVRDRAEFLGEIAGDVNF